MRSRRLVWLASLLLVACAADPVDPGSLELVHRVAPEEPPPPRLLRARLRGSVEGSAPLELWLPLPAEGPGQVVDSLVVEVGPAVAYDLVGPEGGDRVLHVSGPPPRLTAGWRATVTQPLAATAPLPASLQALAGADHAAWVEAARARGAEARLARGLVPIDDEGTPGATAGATATRDWAEVRQDETWRAVDPAAGRLLTAPPGLRLGSDRPRAAVGGAEAAPAITAELTGE